MNGGLAGWLAWIATLYLPVFLTQSEQKGEENEEQKTSEDRFRNQKKKGIKQWNSSSTYHAQGSTKSFTTTYVH